MQNDGVHHQPVNAQHSQPLEGEVLEEAKHSLPPHQDEGRLIHAQHSTIDKPDRVPKRTARVRPKIVSTYVFPVASRSGFCSSRL